MKNILKSLLEQLKKLLKSLINILNIDVHKIVRYTKLIPLEWSDYGPSFGNDLQVQKHLPNNFHQPPQHTLIRLNLTNGFPPILLKLILSQCDLLLLLFLYLRKLLFRLFEALLQDFYLAEGLVQATYFGLGLLLAGGFQALYVQLFLLELGLQLLDHLFQFVVLCAELLVALVQFACALRESFVFVTPVFLFLFVST